MDTERVCVDLPWSLYITLRDRALGAATQETVQAAMADLIIDALHALLDPPASRHDWRADLVRKHQDPSPGPSRAETLDKAARDGEES